MAQSPVSERAAPEAEPALADVQRLVVSAFAHLPWARYHLLRFDQGAEVAPARRWLASLADDLPSAEVRDEERALAVAFTADGLVALGTLPDLMATFPRAFRQGMAHPYRSRLLGDTGDSAPDGWSWGGPGSVPHVLVAQFCRTAEQLTVESQALTDDAAAVGLSVDRSIDTMLLPDGVEHFGFADGISQPVMAGTEWAGRASAPRWDVVAPGEFVLGLLDELGLVAEFPQVGELEVGRHGSYLVMRQIEQHVDLFHDHLGEAAAERGVPVDDLASELVGRRRDGASLAIGAPDAVPGERPSNDFGYGQDPLGVGCPLGSHVRRANPRDGTRVDSDSAREEARRSANRHRLLRRGRPYGPGDDSRTGDEPRGLLFLAFNADIERQFEFVQHTWLGNPTFAGLSGELDPITVEQPSGGGRFSIPQRPVRDRVDGLPSFTTTRGGAYFFLPGIEGLRLLMGDAVVDPG